MSYQSRENDKVKAFVKGIIYTAIFSSALFIGFYEYFRVPNVEKSVSQKTVKELNYTDLREVYVAIGDIGDREDVSVDDFEKRPVPSNIVPKNVITDPKQITGKKTQYKIYANQMLQLDNLVNISNMHTDKDRLIEHKFAKNVLPRTIKQGSIIDVKLFVKNGEDQIVLSKVTVVDRLEDVITFHLDLVEQERLKEASDGNGKLIVTEYLNASQEASEVTYKPDLKGAE